MPANGAAGDGYLRGLVERADALRLAEHPQWLALLHYVPRRGARHASEADDPRFFLSERGKHDPAAELEATLAAFFSTRTVPERGEPVQCAFIARYRWLRGVLGSDVGRLGEPRCDRFERWYRAIDAHSLTLVFPADYLNNPASMFGHTLLRVDRAHDSASAPLLSYAVNYGAVTGDDGGVMFAIKGLTGGYRGLFSIAPYYEKVREYSDLENRDIWEYELSFTPAEVQRLIEHLWELRGVGFDYYFFSENCAYQVLTLLDVARPSLTLAQRFDAWVIPADTIRLLRTQGLLVNATYRPAAATRLAQDASRLTHRQQRLAKDLAEQSMDADSVRDALDTPAVHRNVVELAYDYLHYERLAGRAAGESQAQHLYALLKVRAGIDSTPAPRTYTSPALRPEQGHPTAMVSAGGGTRSPDSFQTVRFRPAFHDLLDPAGGYTKGAEIAFFDTQMRRYPAADEVVLERFSVVDILSLSPRDLFFEPLSWRIRTGWDRKPLPLQGERDELTFATEGGGGMARRFGRHVLAYGLLEMSLEINDKLPGGYALGPGASVGALLQLPGRVKLGATGHFADYMTGHRFTRRDLALQLRHTLNRRNQLALVVARQEADRETRRDRYITWRHFF
ncbi:MAG: DUF4105 domain-containing protein [Gammaproteobacteria bacterium]|nr:DUF4105 domain-containing protein [Gammaproteobacteria bacterium]